MVGSCSTCFRVANLTALSASDGVPLAEPLSTRQRVGAAHISSRYPFPTDEKPAIHQPARSYTNLRPPAVQASLAGRCVLPVKLRSRAPLTVFVLQPEMLTNILNHAFERITTTPPPGTVANAAGFKRGDFDQFAA